MEPFYERMPGPAFGEADPADAPPGVAPPEEAFPTETSPISPQNPTAVIAPALPLPDATARRRAGTAVVVVGVGAGAGALLGGLWGVGSGALLAGALVNAVRAKLLFSSSSELDRKEAVKTTVMAVLGLGAGGYLGYRASQRDEPDDDE